VLKALRGWDAVSRLFSRLTRAVVDPSLPGPARAAGRRRPVQGSRAISVLIVATVDVALTVVPPLALAGMLVSTPGAASASSPASTSAPSAKPGLASTSVRDNHLAMTQGCTDALFDPDRCTWNKGAVNGTVLLLGDSEAYAVADGVVAAATRLGMSTVVSSRSGCPFLTLNSTGHKTRDCPAWQGQMLRYALDTRPAVVVIANRSSGYTRPESGWRTVMDNQGRVADSANAMSLYESGLNDLVSTLRSAGIGSVLVQNAPEPGQQTAGTGSFSSAASIANRSRAARAEALVVSANPETVLFDPIPALCPSGLCPLSTKGANLYRDHWHLTRDGSLLLASSLVGAIHRADTGG
jgi:hypothetical protein